MHIESLSNPISEAENPQLQGAAILEFLKIRINVGVFNSRVIEESRPFRTNY